MSKRRLEFKAIFMASQKCTVHLKTSKGILKAKKTAARVHFPNNTVAVAPKIQTSKRTTKSLDTSCA